MPARWRTASWVALLATAIVSAVVPWPPDLVERVYVAGVYPHVQRLLTPLTNQLPFAWLDVLVSAALAAVTVRLVATWRARRSIGQWLIGRTAAGMGVAAAVYLVFLGAWGCNYQRAPARSRFDVQAALVNPARLESLARRAVDEVNTLHAATGTAPLGWPDVTTALAPAFAAATRETGTAWEVVPGQPKSGVIPRTFPWAAVDGMINPFGLEVLVNPEVLPVERPFVLAHEWAHLAGHADESDASFVGFVTCLRGPGAVRYSGWLTLLLHAARGLPAHDRDPVLRLLAAGPRADIQAIAGRLTHARPLVHAVSWRIYDEYLKANRVDAGIASYDAVVSLVLGARITAGLVDAPSTTRP